MTTFLPPLSVDAPYSEDAVLRQRNSPPLTTQTNIIVACKILIALLEIKLQYIKSMPEISVRMGNTESAIYMHATKYASKRTPSKNHFPIAVMSQQQ